MLTLSSVKSLGTISDSGLLDPVNRSADAVNVSELPTDVLPFLMASRYCETDLLSNFAWSNFGSIKGGWAQSRASVCPYIVVSSSRSGLRNVEDGIHDKLVSARS